VLVPHHFLAAAVAIGTDAPDGSRVWIGSGTAYAKMDRADPAGTRWFLVTNRHVIESLEKAYLRANTWDPANPTLIGVAREVELTLQGPNGEQFWWTHPDPDIDIAVTLINIAGFTAVGFRVYFFEDDVDALTVAQMAAIPMSEGDGVYGLGFPMGLVGGDKNRPIVRGGWIARLQDLLAGESNTFLIDSAVFPGQSGGPVVSRPEALALPGGEALASCRLLGVVVAYVPYRDTAVSSQTGQVRITFDENSGLAWVYPIDRIEETIAAVPVAQPTAPVEEAAPADVEPLPGHGEGIEVEPGGEPNA
jgi:trypsin-like peptidase